MIKLLVIADDFTGALDTGIQFNAKDTRVLIGGECTKELEKIKETAQVVIVDAETRHMSPTEAYRVVFDIVQEAVRIQIPYIYKKTDSGLRGNIGAELGAALEASGQKRLHFIPAFPVMGRVTRDGIHYVNGVKVSESAFRNDPFNPVTESYVPDIIHQQTDLPSKLVKAGDISSEEGILVYDAENNEDLNALADALKKAGELSLLGGCAGFASALPELLEISQCDAADIKKGEGFLFLCGSVNPTTKVQVQYADDAGFTRISLKNSQKLDINWADAEAIERLNKKLMAKKSAVVESFSDKEEKMLVEYAKDLGFDTEDIRVKISSTLGELLKRLIDAGLEKTCMITGGDTLLAFMNAIEAKQLTPVCELKPGVVLSAVIYRGKILQLISKSGGFGDQELLTELAEMLSEKRSD